MIQETPTLRDTMTSMLETMQITDNIKADVRDGKLSPEDGRELIDAILAPVPADEAGEKG